MNIKKKLIIFVISFAMILSIFPKVYVQAATTDNKIISKTEVTANQAKAWAKSKGATEEFMNLAKLYWDYSSEHGNVNPAIAYVQSAKETGYGKFGGVIDASFHNPCGLKTAAGGDNYDPNAHQRFSSWDIGVQAHLDHLALYAGANGYPKSDSNDPRHFRTIKGKATTVSSLSGNWAPSSTYGDEINALYESLLLYSGIEEEDKSNNNNSNNNNNNSNNNSGTSNVTPNPGTQESKPDGVNISEVVSEIKPEITDNIGKNDKVNITSNIGWKKEDGNWYYYKSDNTKAKGWINPDGDWYHLNEDGKMEIGWLNDNGTWYYFNKSGIMVNGWLNLDENWYYLKNSGAMATGFINDGTGLYYLKDSGVMSRYNGWTAISGKWYYFDNSKVRTGWLKQNNNWYFLQGDGSMVTGLRTIDSKNYYFGDNGVMKTEWTNINGNWYYFNSDGTMATGWINENGQDYYLYDNGVMAKGWLNLNGTWYYLKDNGVMATGWATSNGDTYYLDISTGRMLTNTIIDGYNIGSDGKRQGNKNENNDIDSSETTTPSNPNNQVPSTGKKVIVVDPGHDYGKDYGAESNIDGVTYSETDLNMQAAEKLKTELEKRGYTVIMTRQNGERPSYGSLTESLTHRVNAANNINADLFISIHHNSATASASGVETYYTVTTQDDSFGGKLDQSRIEESKKLATAINNSISDKINAKNRGAKSDAGRSLFVLRNTNMPAVLIEVGFITNPDEAKRTADSNSQQEVAEAIASAVANNF